MRILVTGTAGFIGFHLSKLLLDDGHNVHGYDGLTDYYDVSLKKKRHCILKENKNFSFTEDMLENFDALRNSVNNFNPEIIIHLAAQAGVRYSLEHPRAYIDSNIVGSFNVLEIAREKKNKHIMMASTSSVYGGNIEIPFLETDKSDLQLTIYAATKKASESMAHSYAHLWNLPITVFRFFTVYGPWGRPDMALFKFVSSICNSKPIDVYNHGKMYRDFTYIDDLVYGIKLLMNKIPNQKSKQLVDGDTLSPVAPYRVVNIGNAEKVNLIEFIETIEELLNKKAIRNYLPMQTGDVLETYANNDLLKNLTGYKPKTNYKDGISNFISWYKRHYKN